MNRYTRRNIKMGRNNRYPSDYRRRDRMENPMGDRYYEPYGNMRPMSDYGYPMQYEMYGYGRSKPYDYSNGEMEYNEELNRWIEKLKRYDKYGMTKEQLIQHSRQMGVSYKDYTEDEFYATYLMMQSDYKTVSNDPNVYITLAKEFLEDDDSALKGGEKLCEYYYSIILGEE